MPGSGPPELGGLVVDLGNTIGAATDDLDAALSVDARLTEIERQVDRLADRTGTRLSTTHRAAASIVDLRAEARTRLEQRGLVDTEALLGLIDERAAAERRQRRSNLRPFRVELDRYDVLAAISIGTAAALVDAFVVRIPKDLTWGDTRQRGSWLTKTMRDMSIPADNWMSKLAEVPFDHVSGLGEHVPGIGPATHRIHTLGHDPLVGLLFGTLDILRGTLTGVDKYGRVAIVDIRSPVTRNPVMAIGLEILHLLSDLPTKMGLPLPGWSILTTSTMEVRGRPLNEVARQMYLRGYDSWHLLTMATVPTTIELGLRAYWGLRHYLDDEWSARVTIAGDRAASEGVADHPRFAAMLLAAHATASAGNIAKLIAHGGNPLAINYAQWVRFLTVAARAGRRSLTSTPTTDALVHAYEDGAAELDDAWTSLVTPPVA